VSVLLRYDVIFAVIQILGTMVETRTNASVFLVREYFPVMRLNGC
jgi:hypothetical protein